MKQKTKTTTKVKKNIQQTVKDTLVLNQTSQDFRNALLIVSVGINLFVLTAWIALQVTTVYDAQVAHFLFVR